MSTEFEGIKALLDAHLSNLRNELSKLTSNYDSIRDNVQSLKNNTDVAIAEMRKDIRSLENRQLATEEEVKAIKNRVEIGEDVQQGKWTVLETEKKIADKKQTTIIGLLVGAIATTISLILSSLYNYFFK